MMDWLSLGIVAGFAVAAAGFIIYRKSKGGSGSSARSTIDNTPYGKLVPANQPVCILAGHDNGVVHTASDGTVWMATGDGVVGNTKYETAVFYKPKGKDAQDPRSWVFDHGTGGKAYGIICVGNTPYLLKSLSGSMWTGTQNVRVYNVKTRQFVGPVMQTLDSRGVNWSFIQKGPGNGGSSTVTVICVRAAKNKFNEGKSPVQAWKVQLSPNNCVVQGKVSDGIAGLNGPRRNYATTCSITKIGSKWIGTIGDIVTGQIFQFTAPTAMGPYSHVSTETYSPPMTRKTTSAGGEHITSGPFTWNFFEDNGWIYESVTGCGHPSCDSVYIRKMRRQ